MSNGYAKALNPIYYVQDNCENGLDSKTHTQQNTPVAPFTNMV